MNSINLTRIDDGEAVSEYYKQLRTNIYFCGQDKQCIAFTSSFPNEGKSTVVFNLCKALAEDGKRVILLDADLRKSVLYNRCMPDQEVKGLSHYLAGFVPLNEVICKTNIKNMYMEFAGLNAPNPAELLGNPKFKAAIEAMKKSFNYIIVDCAPIGAVIDAAVVAKSVDGMVMVIEQKKVSRRMAQKMKEYQNSLDAMSNEAVEYVRGIPVVKTFGQTVFSFKRFKATIDNYEKWVISYTKDLRIPMMLYTAAINSVFVFLIAAALIFTKNGVTNEFLLNLIFYIIITPVISLTLTKMMYQSENAMIVADALQRVDTILDAEQLPETVNGKKPSDSSVEFRNVSYSYDGVKNAVENISLNIPSGSTVAFVGPSGSGKSTMANLISRFFDVSEGQVLVGGVDVRNIKKDILMDNVSFVFQNSHLIKGTILDNVRMARPQASKEEVMNVLEKSQCMDIVKKLPNGVDTVVGTNGVYLSGGEQQRIAIARVMLKNSPVVILDEATAFADPDNEVMVQKAFSELAKDRTVIMIAHRLSTVAGADRIYVLKDGKIEEYGKYNELINNGGMFSKMWNDYRHSVDWKVSKEASL